MKKAIIGTKIGMTQVFTDNGEIVPVTVIQAGPCTVTQVMTADRNGYSAVQVAYKPVDEKKLNKPERGHFKAVDIPTCRYLREFRLDDAGKFERGQEINVTTFAVGEYVDVSGTSRGHGFAGAIKRYGFHRGPMTHGSKYHRHQGSLASRDAARIFKGRKMPGHYGDVHRTVQNLAVVRVDPARNLMLVRGSVPGSKGSLVLIRDSVKA